MVKVAFVAAAVLASCSWGAHATDLTQQQKNAVNHIAQVIATADYCQSYKANAAGIGRVSEAYNIDLHDKYIRNVMVLLVREHRTGLEAAGKNAGCLVAYGLYGPGGENVPGLLVKR